MKSYIVKRKEFIDQDGNLIQDKRKILEEASKMKLISGLDLAQNSSKERLHENANENSKITQLEYELN